MTCHITSVCNVNLNTKSFCLIFFDCNSDLTTLWIALCLVRVAWVCVAPPTFHFRTLMNKWTILDRSAHLARQKKWLLLYTCRRWSNTLAYVVQTVRWNGKKTYYCKWNVKWCYYVFLLNKTWNLSSLCFK